MSEHVFQYAILRYVHDPITEEFINIGVVVYSANVRYLKVLVSHQYGRLSNVFQQVNGGFYRSLANTIERRIINLSSKLSQGDWTISQPERIEDLLLNVLVPDDSSLVFGGYGGGVSENLDSELDALYNRLVKRYAEREDKSSRDDEQVFRSYRGALEKWDVLSHLSGVTIRTDAFSHDFRYTWKNERYHPIEPVSLDLVNPSSIFDKAHRWMGRITALRHNDELGTVYLLLGAPSNPELGKVYEDAKTNLRVDGRGIELVEEEDAEEFGKRMADLIRTHAQ